MSVTYRPIKPLASGGMADVWLGLQMSDSGFTRLCAIKTVQKTAAGERDDFISMFRDEALICQTLHHANIVQVLDFTVLEHHCALIMEYVQGVNVSQLLKAHQKQNEIMPIEIAAYIAREIARGLHYVHTRNDPATGQNLGIVHRDISPSNILISIEGEIKITDFGIAKALGNQTQTQTGVVKGKFQYMSPEQFRGEKIDHRADLYALGTILFECLAGRKLYEAENDAHLIQLLMQQNVPPRLQEFNPHVSEQLQAIVDRCLASNVNDRYATGEQIADDLNAFLQGTRIAMSTLTMSTYLGDRMPDKIREIQASVKEVIASVNLNGSPSLDSTNQQLAVASNVYADEPSEPLTKSLQWQSPSQMTRSTVLHQRRVRKKTRAIPSQLIVFAVAVVILVAGAWWTAENVLMLNVKDELGKWRARALVKEQKR